PTVIYVFGRKPVPPKESKFVLCKHDDSQLIRLRKVNIKGRKKNAPSRPQTTPVGWSGFKCDHAGDSTVIDPTIGADENWAPGVLLNAAHPGRCQPSRLLTTEDARP